MPMSGARRGVLAGTDPDEMLAAWSAAVETAGGSVSSDRKIVVRQFYRDLEVGGLLPRIDQLNAWWGENEAQACVCLVSRRVAVPVNGPVFEASKGVTSNGVSSYYNTLYNAAAHARAATGGNHHFGAQILTNVSGTMSVMGASGGGSTTRLRPRTGSNTVGVQIGSALSAFVDPVTDSTGYLSVQRAGTAIIQGRKDDTALTDLTVGTLATTLPSAATFVLARNNSGPAAEFFTGQAGLTYEAASVTTTQWTAMRDAIRRFGQAVGAM